MSLSRTVRPVHGELLKLIGGTILYIVPSATCKIALLNYVIIWYNLLFFYQTSLWSDLARIIHDNITCADA